jgi:uncharacterized membrane protein YbaN (DUF454 family)
MLKRLALIGLGWAFIVLGIAGLFLPVLQGILFLCVGLIILSFEYEWARRLLQKVKSTFPVVDRQCIRARQTIASLPARWPKIRRVTIAFLVGLFLLTATAVCVLLLGPRFC